MFMWIQNVGRHTPRNINIPCFSFSDPPRPRLLHNNIYKSIDQSYSFAGQLRRCHAHTTPGGHIGRHIRIFLADIFSGMFFSSLSALGHEFPNQLVVVRNKQTFLSERKLWEECTELANLLESRHKAHCPQTNAQRRKRIKASFGVIVWYIADWQQTCNVAWNLHPLLPICFCIVHCIAQKTHSLSVTKASQLMLYREIIAVCSQIHTKHINTQRE